MKPDERVFFASIEDAIKGGYRPCKLCRPIDENQFKSIATIVPFDTLQEFYNAKPRKTGRSPFLISAIVLVYTVRRAPAMGML